MGYLYCTKVSLLRNERIGVVMSDIRYISFDLLEKFMEDTFVKLGSPREQAKIIADVLIMSDKLGIDSHGVGRFKPIYVDRINTGILNPVTKIDILKESPTTAILDANDGMGHVVSKRAMEIAIEKAKIYGMGMVTVKNSSHYGFAGYYPLMASKEGMIGITGTNARPSIAPTFGVENMLGTNPLTFAIPTDEEFDFLLDCATSTSQRGKIEKYDRENKPLPEGWVIDDEGNVRTDTKQVLVDLTKGKAALTPLGGVGEELAGYKGYGYATVVEILSSALHLGPFMKALTDIDENGNKKPYKLGHFFIAINVENFVEIDKFRKQTGNILRDLRASKKAPGENRIYTAGEKEYITYQYRKDKGVPMNDVLIKQINELNDKYSLGYNFSEY
jgi:LDH2 family malate/lactate/ureidoglycolate dehydrogenase